MTDTSGQLTREPLVITGAALDAVEALAALKTNERLQENNVEDEAIVREVRDIVNDVDSVENFDDFLANFDG
jgi:hypothetical protein